MKANQSFVTILATNLIYFKFNLFLQLEFLKSINKFIVNDLKSFL